MPSFKEMSSVKKEHDKLYSRARAFSSKERLETGETSFRVYYGATGAAVPFMWESQPGTPKHPMFDKSHGENDDIVPPLTPPPSYTSSSSLCKISSNNNNKSRKHKILNRILSSMSRKNSHVTPSTTTSSLSSPLSWSTSSSSSSSTSSPYRGGSSNKHNKSHRRSISFCSIGAKSPLIFGDEIGHGNFTSSSTMCFGFKKKQGRYSMHN